MSCGYRGHSSRSAGLTLSGPVVRKHIMTEGRSGGELPLFFGQETADRTEPWNKITPKEMVLRTYFFQLDPTFKSFQLFAIMPSNYEFITGLVH